MPLTESYTGNNLNIIVSSNAINKKWFEELRQLFPKFTVKCEYTTHVYETEGERDENEGPGQANTIVRKVCILNRALHFSMHYFRANSTEDFMRFVDDSLKFVYIIACSIAKFLGECSDSIAKSNSTKTVLKNKYPLALMVDSESKRHEIITKNIFYITREEYEKMLKDSPSASRTTRRESAPQGSAGLLSRDVVNVELV